MRMRWKSSVSLLFFSFYPVLHDNTTGCVVHSTLSKGGVYHVPVVSAYLSLHLVTVPSIGVWRDNANVTFFSGGSRSCVRASGAR